MRDNSPISPEVWKLIDDLLNERIDAAGFARLESELTNDEQARAFFAAYSQLHLDVVMDQHSEQVVRTFLSGRAAGRPRPEIRRDDQNQKAPPRTTELPHRSGTRTLRSWAVAAGVALAAIGLWWSMKSPNVPLMAVISGVEIDENRVKLAIANVGTVYLEDSANFSIVGPKRARLAHGRIKMRVSEETGHGFVVETPYGDITDNGTEFGLDVDEKGSACVVVFEGSVDLSVENQDKTRPTAHIERLTGGEGLLFYDGGRIDRVNSISSGTVSTFLRDTHTIAADRRVIANVSDNLRPADTKKFYDIVAGGLREDALAYVDRPHDWNGVTEAGMPSYLAGADYVRTFNDDKGTRDIEIQLNLSQPAKLYVFLDSRVEIPEWLARDFQPTGDTIGLDEGRRFEEDKHDREFGPGKFDTKFQVWVQNVEVPGIVRLGPNGGVRKNTGRPTHFAMYGIAAVRDAASRNTSVTDKLEPPAARRQGQQP